MVATFNCTFEVTCLWDARLIPVNPLNYHLPKRILSLWQNKLGIDRGMVPKAGLLLIFLAAFLSGCSNKPDHHTTWSNWVTTVPVAESKTGFEITSDTVIWIGPETEGTVVEFAADQLQSFISKIAEFELPVRRIDSGFSLDSLDQKVILLGQTALTEELNRSLSSAPSDAFVIRTNEDWMVIAGRDNLDAYDKQGMRVAMEAGTLHGVNALMEHLGLRAFFELPELDVMPGDPSLVIPYSEFRDAPYFPFHLVYGRSKSWTTHLKGGGQKAVYDQHTFKGWPDQYGPSKPDWFLTGEISEAGHYIDFNNPEVRATILSLARAHFDWGGNYYDLIQNDGFFYDRTQYVSSNVTHENYLSLHSDMMMGNFAEIAEELLLSHPDKKVVLCAYDSYSMPPEEWEDLPANVVVHVALRRRNNVLEEGKRENRELLNAWLDLNPSEIYWWEYFGLGKKPWFNESYELFPRFIPQVIEDDIRYLAELRKSNPALQGEWLFHNFRSDELNGWWCTINAYLIGKLLWNPFSDVDALLDDFYTKAFGEASDEMKAFYQLCETAWMDGARLCVDSNPPDFLRDKRNVAWGRAMGHHYFDIHFEKEDFRPAWPDSVVTRLEGLLESAVEKVADGPHRNRVDYVVEGFDAFQKLLEQE